MLYCNKIYINEDHDYDLLLIESSSLLRQIFSTKKRVEHLDDIEQLEPLLKKNNYDFIVINVSDFTIDSEQLLINIQEFSDAKVIMLCSDEEKETRERLFEKGILDYFTINDDIELLASEMRDAIAMVLRNINSNILLVSDSAASSKQLQKICLVRNYDVDIVESKEDALEKLDTKKMFNAILIDLEHPSQEGVKLLREIKSNDEFCHIPILLLSSKNDSDIIQKALRMGASYIIQKPISVEELILKIALSVETNRRYVEAVCSQNMLSEYKDAIDEASVVSKADPKGIITYVNETFCKLSGYSEKELIGSPHNIVRHPDVPSSVFKEMWATIKSKQIWKGIIKNRKKNGEAYFVKSLIKPILDVNGEIFEYIAIRTDVTELETYKAILEENIEASNSNLQYLKQYENAIDQFILIVKTDIDNVIIYANENFSKISGYTKEELIGMNCSDIRAQHHRDKGDCAGLAERLKNKESISILFENIAKDGSHYHVDTKIYPIVDSNGVMQERLHIMYDITEIVKIHEELDNTQREIINTMGEVGESRSQETGYHVKRVAEYSKLLAQLAGLNEKDVDLLYSASPMHDIGKVGIPDSILKKPGKLTDEEWIIMKSHSEIGFNILHSSKRPILKAAATISYTHHEKWDGTGYPKGLKAEEIPIFGRITAVADVFDALGSDRLYKKAWELDRILTLFKEDKGKHFDPALIDLFLENLDKFLTIRDKYKDQMSHMTS